MYLRVCPAFTGWIRLFATKLRAYKESHNYFKVSNSITVTMPAYLWRDVKLSEHRRGYSVDVAYEMITIRF